jgi:hypothetical protein
MTISATNIQPIAMPRGKNRAGNWVAFAALLLIFLSAIAPASARGYAVSAYCRRGKTALGTRPRHGICAGPRRYLGQYVRIGGRRYRVEDTCRHGFDVWVPTRQACRRFGRRQLPVEIEGANSAQRRKGHPRSHGKTLTHRSHRVHHLTRRTHLRGKKPAHRAHQAHQRTRRTRAHRRK